MGAGPEEIGEGVADAGVELGFGVGGKTAAVGVGVGGVEEHGELAIGVGPEVTGRVTDEDRAGSCGPEKVGWGDGNAGRVGGVSGVGRGEPVRED